MNENNPAAKDFRFYDLVMVIFVTVLLISNIASSAKIIDWGVSLLGLPLAFDAGHIAFPDQLHFWRCTDRSLWIQKITPGHMGRF